MLRKRRNVASSGDACIQVKKITITPRKKTKVNIYTAHTKVQPQRIRLSSVSLIIFDLALRNSNLPIVWKPNSLRSICNDFTITHSFHLCLQQQFIPMLVIAINTFVY